MKRDYRILSRHKEEALIADKLLKNMDDEYSTDDLITLTAVLWKMKPKVYEHIVNAYI